MLNDFEIIPINCIWAEPDELIIRIKQLRESSDSRNWIYSLAPFDLKCVYFPAPPKGGAHLPRFAVWQPNNMSFGSVLVPNYLDGMIQLMRHLNRRFQISYFAAFLAKDHMERGFAQFEYAQKTGEVRVVQVIRDPKWQFFEKGDVLPFERTNYYKNQFVAERLTPAIILEYLESLGWNLSAESFWKSKGQSWFARQTAFK